MLSHISDILYCLKKYSLDLFRQSLLKKKIKIKNIHNFLMKQFILPLLCLSRYLFFKLCSNQFNNGATASQNEPVPIAVILLVGLISRSCSTFTDAHYCTTFHVLKSLYTVYLIRFFSHTSIPMQGYFLLVFETSQMFSVFQYSQKA